ncbi:MAG: hypothetical protein SCALA702_17770 [Melioribacteraceae bacterium]|nr:MAG: hypothetical protein SCALA702_17770 [Melioribacteraceae bacterium]
MNSTFETQKHVEHWLANSDDDYETMMAVYQARKYNWSLFIGHLVIEKLLKALYVSLNNESPPYIHNLVRLAQQTGLEIDDDLLNDLTTISAFNINAR